MSNYLYVIDLYDFFVQKREKMVALEEVRAVVTLKLRTGKTTLRCPRCWRLSASRGPNRGPTLKAVEHHSGILSMGLRGALNSAPIMPRDARLTDIRFDFPSLV